MRAGARGVTDIKTHQRCEVGSAESEAGEKEKKLLVL